MTARRSLPLLLMLLAAFAIGLCGTILASRALLTVLPLRTPVYQQTPVHSPVGVPRASQRAVDC